MTVGFPATCRYWSYKPFYILVIISSFFLIYWFFLKSPKWSCSVSKIPEVATFTSFYRCNPSTYLLRSSIIIIATIWGHNSTEIHFDNFFTAWTTWCCSKDAKSSWISFAGDWRIWNIVNVIDVVVNKLRRWETEYAS